MEISYELSIGWGSVLLLAGFLAAVIAGAEEKISFALLSVFGVVTGSVLLFYTGASAGHVGIEENMDSQTYVLVGGPFSASEHDAKKLILVHVPQEDSYAFAIESFPPKGFVVKKTDDGLTLLVPDESKAK